MKRSIPNSNLLAIFLSCLVIGLIALGCQTPVQRTGYNTIYTVESAASIAVDGYYTLVIKGVVPTNDVPKVAAMFNRLQTDATIAAAAAQNGVNATATPALIAQGLNLTSLIATITGNK